MGRYAIYHLMSGTSFNLSPVIFIKFVQSIKDLTKDVYNYYYTYLVYNYLVDQKVLNHQMFENVPDSIRSSILVGGASQG